MLDFHDSSRDDYHASGAHAAPMVGKSGRRVWTRVTQEGETQGPDAAERQHLTACLVAVGRYQDRAAFAALFQYYAPRVKSFMRQLGTDDGMAEELAQEALMAVWRKAPLFDPAKAGAGTWIFTIARNLRIDMLRQQRHPEIDSDDAALVPDPAPGADDVMATAEQEGRVRLAMAALPPEQATVVRLSFFEDAPHAEIAVRLNLPLGTVKSRLRLAMARIRQALGDLREDGTGGGRAPAPNPAPAKDGVP